MSPTAPPLETRLRSLSAELCAALRAALGEALGMAAATGDDLRPVQLTQDLGLNKSLASRVVRALKETDALRALQSIPTPQGLHLLEQAAAKAGASAAPLERLGAATSAYGALLAEFSGGRTDLEATLVGWIPEQRERAERDARRSVFRGMTTLSGTRARTIYNSLYLLPSEELPGRLDTLLVAVRQDVRRLRAGARILVMSIAASDRSLDWRARRRALDGAPLDKDPRSLVLPDLSSHPLPKLELESDTPSSMSVRIAEDAMDVNEFTTLGFGWRTLGHFARFATEGASHGHISIIAAMPSEALTLDLFVHRDVALTGDPFSSITQERTLIGQPKSEPPTADAPERTEAPGVIHLDAHPSGLASQDVRSCKAVAENACREAGLDPADFRKYRTRIEFPIQTEEITLWWPLPVASGNAV